MQQIAGHGHTVTGFRMELGHPVHLALVRDFGCEALKGRLSVLIGQVFCAMTTGCQDNCIKSPRKIHHGEFPPHSRHQSWPHQKRGASVLEA